MNGYSGYFAPHYGALVDLLQRHEPAVLDAARLVRRASKSSSTTMATPIAAGATFVGGLPNARVVQQETDYTVYLIPEGGERLQLPQFAAQPLPIASDSARPTATTASAG